MGPGCWELSSAHIRYQPGYNSLLFDCTPSKFLAVFVNVQIIYVCYTICVKLIFTTCDHFMIKLDSASQGKFYFYPETVPSLSHVQILSNALVSSSPRTFVGPNRHLTPFGCQ